MNDIPPSPEIDRRTHRLLIGLASGLVFSVILIVAIFARWQTEQTDFNRDATRLKAAQATADRRTDLAQSLALAAYSQELLAQGNTSDALALAMEAVQSVPSLPEVQSNLADVAYTPGIRRWIDLPVVVGSESMVTSPDGKTIICGGKQLIILDANTGQELRRLGEEGERIVRVVISPDGQKVFSAAGTHYRVWDLQTGEIVSELAEYTGDQADALFSPDSRRLVLWSSQDRPVLWDLETDRAIRHYEVGPERIGQAAISPSGRLLLLSTFGPRDELILVDIETGEVLRRLSGPQPYISAIAFYADDTMFFTGGRDGSLFRWSLDTGQVTDEFKGASKPIYHMTVSPDNWTLVTSGDWYNEMIWWNIPYAQLLRRFPGIDASNVVFSPDGRSAIIGPTLQQSALVIDLVSGADERHFRGYSNPIRGMAFSPAGQWIAGGSVGGELFLWEARSGRQVRQFVAHTAEITGVAFSPQGDTIVSAGRDGRVILWDVKTGDEIWRLSEEPSALYVSLAFSPDGRGIAAGSWNSGILIWDVPTRQLVHRLKSDAPTRAMVFSPDGRSLLANSLSDPALWDVNSGQVLHHFDDRSGGFDVQTLSFSPDGQTFLAVYANHALDLWDVQTETVLRRLDGIYSADFAPQGTMLGVITRDGDLAVLDASTWQPVRRWEVGSGVAQEGLTYLHFSPDSQWMLTNGPRNDLILWRVDTLEELIHWVNYSRYVPDLTCEQQERYRLDRFCDEQGDFPTRTPVPTQTASLTPDFTLTTATPTESVTATIPVPSLNAPSFTPSPAPNLPPLIPSPTPFSSPTHLPSPTSYTRPTSARSPLPPHLTEPPAPVRPTATPSITPPVTEAIIIVEVSDVPGLLAAVETANASGETTAIEQTLETAAASATLTPGRQLFRRPPPSK